MAPSTHTQLYKFSSFENAKSILESSALWSKSPLSFNDPFEMLPSLDEERKNMVVKSRREFSRLLGLGNAFDLTASGEEEKIPVEDFVDFSAHFHDDILSAWYSGYSVVCFSEVVDEILLWSHYADSHRGIAIGFDWDKGSVPRGRFPDGLNVKYVPDRSELMLPIDFYRFRALDLLDRSRWPEGYRKLADGSFVSEKQEKEVQMEGLYRMLGQKFDAWKHEQERRFVYDHQISEDDLPFFGTDSEGWGQRAVHFQPENVTEIVFGYRCTDEEIQSYEGVLKKYPHAKLCYVDFHPTEYKVRLHEGCWEQILTTHAMRFTSFRSVKKREPEEE
jgi:hypothetical protein